MCYDIKICQSQNIVKIGQMIAKIQRLTFFKMAAFRHLGFLEIFIFEQPLRSGGPICVTVQNFIKIV